MSQPDGGILPDYPPVNMIQGEAAQFIANFLKKEGPARVGYQPSKGTDNKQIPQVSMPGHILLALGSLAGHPALPYSGNVAALIRDLIYIGAGAFSHVLSQYSDDEEGTFTAHIIRQEETYRRGLLVDLISMSRSFDFAVMAQLLQLALAAGNKTEIFEQLQRLFYDLNQISSRTIRELLLRQMYGTPEIRDALSYLDRDPRYHVNEEMEIWLQRFDELADQIEEES
ncbi:hypothetical protein LCGC14_1243540 [marine sediment metagenome]|uniref:Uncharacterized protein n=1 Tax=marine sediment metagenome TaxID=412755 RepID=A0A0F9NMD3_9ZZZZ